MTISGSKPIIARDAKGREVRYQTDAELGEGAGGAVFLARRLPDDDDAGADEVRRVAIKLSWKAKWKGFLAEEAKILHELQESAAELVDATGSDLYRPVRIRSGNAPLEVDDAYASALIELEYLDGETLRGWFEKSWTPRPNLEPSEIADEVLKIARELCEGLAQLQVGGEARFIHRDLKPDNIMRTGRGLRLFDFNVARPDSESTKTQHVGTSGYMAPEVVAGGAYDARADLFSLGVILWEVAARRRFDMPTHTILKQDELHLRWPLSDFDTWDAEDRKVLDELLPLLITEVNLRFASAKAVLERVQELERARQAARGVEDPLVKHDMISLLTELRPSGLVSVVTDTSGKVPEQVLQDFLRERMQVEDPLEDWLFHAVSQAATAERDGPALFVLAGNAGDGKSHLMYRLLRKRLADKPEVLDRVVAIADATHSLSPSASQAERLREFFSPFADNDAAPSTAVHIIAMNTGMVIRFFEGDEQRDRFAGVYSELQRQLGLRRSGGTDAPAPWPVEVVNLDLRSLVAAEGDRTSFIERMLDRLDPDNEQGISAGKWAECQRCSALSLCPVAFNLRALQLETPRRALLWALRRAALDTDVHLSPRNMWGFLYRAVTGGVERYDVDERQPDQGPCDVVRGRADAEDGQWLLAGQISELLFQQEGAGAPWTGLARHDPAFSSAPSVDQLHTRLSIKTELDNEPHIISALGGEGRRLAGLALDALCARLPQTPAFKGRRRNAAVRRQALFDPEQFSAWSEHDGPGNFADILRAYDLFSRHTDDLGKLDGETQASLKELREVVQEVFIHGNGRTVRDLDYLRVSQPNVRARTELLVRADGHALNEIFSIPRVVVRDLHIAAHDGRPGLLSLLGYRPEQVTLDILGVRLTVDLALYEFLSRVKDGQKPSVRDMSQFQALLFIGERIGNELARNQGVKDVFVWHGDQNALYRLATDDFGQPHLNTVS